jgi:hypothetical protein
MVMLAGLFDAWLPVKMQLLRLVSSRRAKMRALQTQGANGPDATDTA